MLRFLSLILTLGLMTSCASIIKGMGGATDEEVKALKTEISELKSLLSESQTLKNDVVILKLAFQNIQGNIDNLPRETIRRIAEILQRSVADSPRSTQAPAPNPPPSTVP